LATKAHFSSNWASRVLGGKSHEFVVEVVCVRAGQSAVAADRVTVHPTEPPGLADATPLGDVLQDRFGLLRRQSRVEQRGPFSLGEAGLADRTSEHAAGLVGTIAAGDGEVSGAPLTVFGAGGIQATEA
jgi:hypothetical protein